MTQPVAELNVFMGNPWANMGSSMGRFILALALLIHQKYIMIPTRQFS